MGRAGFSIWFIPRGVEWEVSVFFFVICCSDLCCCCIFVGVLGVVLCFLGGVFVLFFFSFFAR